MKVVYPNVICRRGHSSEPGYAICNHVLNGGKISIEIAPTEKKLGVLCCEISLDLHDIKKCRLGCRQCTTEKFLLSRQ